MAVANSDPHFEADLQALKKETTFGLNRKSHKLKTSEVWEAHDLGFECVVVQWACATKDLKFVGETVTAEDIVTAVFATLTGGGYATIISLKDSMGNSAKYYYRVK